MKFGAVRMSGTTSSFLLPRGTNGRREMSIRAGTSAESKKTAGKRNITHRFGGPSEVEKLFRKRVEDRREPQTNERTNRRNEPFNVIVEKTSIIYLIYRETSLLSSFSLSLCLRFVFDDESNDRARNEKDECNRREKTKRTKRKKKESKRKREKEKKRKKDSVCEREKRRE